jgi:hypothetical protein
MLILYENSSEKYVYVKKELICWDIYIYRTFISHLKTDIIKNIIY